MKAREFLIEISPLENKILEYTDKDTLMDVLNNNYWDMWFHTKPIHVIEYTEYELLQARHKKLLEALEFYREYNYLNESNDIRCMASEAIEADRKAEITEK